MKTTLFVIIQITFSLSPAKPRNASYLDMYTFQFCFAVLFWQCVLCLVKKKYAKKRFRENLALPSSMHLPFRSLTKNAPNINTYTFNYIHNTLPYFSRKTNITNNNNPCLSQTRTSKSILYINFQIEFSTTRRYRFFFVSKSKPNRKKYIEFEKWPLSFDATYGAHYTITTSTKIVYIAQIAQNMYTHTFHILVCFVYTFGQVQLT